MSWNSFLVNLYVPSAHADLVNFIKIIKLIVVNAIFSVSADISKFVMKGSSNVDEILLDLQKIHYIDDVTTLCNNSHCFNPLSEI